MVGGGLVQVAVPVEVAAQRRLSHAELPDDHHAAGVRVHGVLRFEVSFFLRKQKAFRVNCKRRKKD